MKQFCWDNARYIFMAGKKRYLCSQFTRQEVNCRPSPLLDSWSFHARASLRGAASRVKRWWQTAVTDAPISTLRWPTEHLRVSCISCIRPSTGSANNRGRANLKRFGLVVSLCGSQTASIHQSKVGENTTGCRIALSPSVVWVDSTPVSYHSLILYLCCIYDAFTLLCSHAWSAAERKRVASASPHSSFWFTVMNSWFMHIDLHTVNQILSDRFTVRMCLTSRFHQLDDLNDYNDVWNEMCLKMLI